MSHITELKEGKLWTHDFIMLLIMSFGNQMSMQFVTSTIALWVNSLGLSSGYTGIFTMCFTLPCIVGCVIWGRLSQKTGRRSLIICGSILFGFGSLGLPFVAPVIWSIVMLRIAQGIGYSAINNGMTSTQADVITPKRLGEGIGYFGMAQSISLVIGPGIALAVAQYFGYTQVFLTMAVICAFIFIGALLLRVDISAASMRKSVRETGEDHPRGIWKYIEKSAIGPACILLLCMAGVGSINFYVSTYMSWKGIGNASMFFVMYAIAQIITIFLIRKWSDRLSMYVFVIPGALVVAVGLFALSMAGTAVGMLAVGAVIGVGAGLILPNIQASILRGVPRVRRGMASATFYIGFDGGMCIGSLLWGVAIERAGYSGMYRSAALLMTAVAAGCVIYVVFKNITKSHYNDEEGS